MFWIDLLFIIVFAGILSSILTWGVGWRHPARSDAVVTSVLFLFVLLLFAMWAGGAWLPPRGPVFRGTPWLSLLLIGLFVSLIVLAVATPVRRPPRTPVEAAEEAREEAVTAAAFGIFFWILILGLLIAAIVSYLV